MSTQYFLQFYKNYRIFHDFILIRNQPLTFIHSFLNLKYFLYILTFFLLYLRYPFDISRRSKNILFITFCFYYFFQSIFYDENDINNDYYIYYSPKLRFRYIKYHKKRRFTRHSLPIIEEKEEYFPPVFNFSETFFSSRSFNTINISQGKNNKPLAALILGTCGKDYRPSGVGIDVYNVHCNKETGNYDCREGSLYLTFIINHYDDPVADYYIFAHGHEVSWHYLEPLSSVIRKVIQHPENFEKPMCGLYNFLVQRHLGFGNPYAEIYSHTFKKLKSYFYPSIDYSTDVVMEFPCCSTFLVRVSEIQKRPKEDYIMIRRNLRKFAYNAKNIANISYQCGLTLEFLYHYIFANLTDLSICAQ